MLETAAADAKKDEDAKIAQPLTTDEIKELAQKGGGIFESLKHLTIPNAIIIFFYKNFNSQEYNAFIKKIKDNSIFLQFW